MGLILYEYQCKGCGKTIESLEPSGTTEVQHCKGSIARRVISAVFGRMAPASITQGKKHTHDRPDWCMNTESLADGQPYSEWKASEMKRLTGRDQAADAAELKDRGAEIQVRSTED